MQMTADCNSKVQCYFFFFYKIQTAVTHARVNFGVCWWWGCLRSADLSVVSASLYRQCTIGLLMSELAKKKVNVNGAYAEFLKQNGAGVRLPSVVY